MTTTLKHLLTVLALAHAPIALSQQSAPVDSIAQATWAQYRDMYGKSPLCEAQEITLWSCAARKRLFALCSSQVVNRTSGHIQYRASKHGKVEFVYPAKKTPPAGFFTFNSAGNGDASIEFSSIGYHYTLVDALRGKSSIFVSTTQQLGRTTEISCGPNQTLQLNYSLRMMYDSGLSTAP